MKVVWYTAVKSLASSRQQGLINNILEQDWANQPGCYAANSWMVHFGVYGKGQGVLRCTD